MNYLSSLLDYFLQKSFAPTIPTRRVKKEPVDESSSSKQVSSAQREGKKEKKKGGHGKERAGDKRRGKEIVTSASVFSMGPAERSIKEKRGQLEGYTVFDVHTYYPIHT